MIRFVSLFFIVILSACTSNSSQVQNSKTSSSPKRIVAYVTSWKNNWGDNFEKANQITHINYAFANIKDGKVVLGHETDTVDLIKLNQLKKVNKDLKILISVGGWSWSKNFSDAVLTKESREVFANSAVDFMLKYHIDGIDLDWEYPGQRGDNNGYRPEDKKHFTDILKLLRNKLDAVSKKNKKYLLTIATGANQGYLDHTNMKEAQQYLDFVNIMTYDFYTGGTGTIGHHSNLFVSNFDHAKGRSSKRAVQEHVMAQIPIEKIVLGVPFYGRWRKKVSPVNNGLYQKSNGASGSYSYRMIADSIQAKTFISYWDQGAKASYVWRKKDSLFITYESVKSLKEKIDFVKKEEMGGLMFWEFNADNGELLKTISDNLVDSNDN